DHAVGGAHGLRDNADCSAGCPPPAGGVDLVSADPRLRTLVEPDSECENCQGRGCMGCVLREWGHDCRNDCPDCCESNNWLVLRVEVNPWRHAYVRAKHFRQAKDAVAGVCATTGKQHGSGKGWLSFINEIGGYTLAAENADWGCR